METSLLPDAISVATTQGLCFAGFLHRNPHSSTSYPLSAISDSGSDPFYGGGTLTISAGALPTDAIAPPAVRSKRHRAAPRTLARRLRRTRKTSTAGGSEDGDSDGFFGSGDGDGFFGSGDGPFGGGGGGGGGGGRWNFDRSGGSDWGESLPYSDPAFDFVYEVLCWIALLHCMHFSFKRMVRIAGDLFREKAPVRFVPSVC